MSGDSVGRNLPAIRNEAGADVDGRHRQISAWTRRGQLQRAEQEEHLLRVERVRHGAVELAASEAADLYVKLARLEARSRFLTEAKFGIERANKESQILAGDDPVLKAKFAILDDDLFAAVRLEGEK